MKGLDSFEEYWDSLIDIPIFSIIFGMTNSMINMKPNIRPIGLLTRDITEKGSLIWNQE